MKLANVTIDCDQPRRLAEFWAAVTGLQIDHIDDYVAFLKPSDGTGPNMLFLKVPEPKTGKNRCHVDFQAEDMEAEVARVVGLGATCGETKNEYGVRWTVLQDPEGNEFCIAG